MSTRVTGMLELKTWEEQPYHAIERGPKLARASVTTPFHGDIEGEGTLEYLMIYHDDASASFVGLERAVADTGHCAGSFVLQHSGAFAGETAQATPSVVLGPGFGELSGLGGEGSFA